MWHQDKADAVSMCEDNVLSEDNVLRAGSVHSCREATCQDPLLPYPCQGLALEAGNWGLELGMLWVCISVQTPWHKQ